MKTRVAWCAGSILVAAAAWVAPGVPLAVAAGVTGFAAGALFWYGLLGSENWMEGSLLAIVLAVLVGLVTVTAGRALPGRREPRIGFWGVLHSREPPTPSHASAIAE